MDILKEKLFKYKTFTRIIGAFIICCFSVLLSAAYFCNENSELKKEVSSISSQFDSINTKYQNLASEYRVLSKEYNEIESEINNYKDQQDKIDELTQQLSDLQSKNTELEEENKSLESQISSLQSEDDGSSSGNGMRLPSSITSSSGGTVWLSATGSKYHSIPDCGNMNPNKARQVSQSSAEASGYEPCSKCY